MADGGWIVNSTGVVWFASNGRADCRSRLFAGNGEWRPIEARPCRSVNRRSGPFPRPKSRSSSETSLSHVVCQHTDKMSGSHVLCRLGRSVPSTPLAGGGGHYAQKFRSYDNPIDLVFSHGVLPWHSRYRAMEFGF